MLNENLSPIIELEELDPMEAELMFWNLGPATQRVEDVIPDFTFPFPDEKTAEHMDEFTLVQYIDSEAHEETKRREVEAVRARL